MEQDAMRPPSTSRLWHFKPRYPRLNQLLLGTIAEQQDAHEPRCENVH
jgi:hypothetical protein